MDTSPPAREPQDARQPAPQPHPAMDIMPSRPAEAPKMPPPGAAAPAPPLAPPKAAAHQEQPAAVTRSPRTPGSGAGLAVAATVVIVLGLGALLVYAYLRSNGISIF